MRFQPGDSVILLENMSFVGAGKSEPMASATIIHFNPLSQQYRISYTLLASGQTGEIEVAEERLLKTGLSQNEI